MHVCVRVCLSIFEYVNLSFHTNPLVLIFFFSLYTGIQEENWGS